MLVKDDEIRIIIGKFEQFKTTKESEAFKLKKKIQQTEDDLKSLLLENEKQKQVQQTII